MFIRCGVLLDMQSRIVWLSRSEVIFELVEGAMHTYEHISLSIELLGCFNYCRKWYGYN